MGREEGEQVVLRAQKKGTQNQSRSSEWAQWGWSGQGDDEGAEKKEGSGFYYLTPMGKMECLIGLVLHL